MDARGTKILVTCMKQTGRKNANIFTWPRVNKDRDWYTIDSVMGIIPEPKHVKGNHFKINDTIWDNLIKCMNN